MSDAVVWEIINHGHCSYKAKMVKQNFCRNEYNVSGLCNRSSCPLANSRYATIREDKGRVYLYIKTIERAHTPKKLWQRIRLSRKYMTALQQLDEHLAYWPKFLVHKNKQRLTKITQYLIRMRKLALKPQKKIVAQPARLKKMEKRKEAKAEKAANIESSIEAELMERLKSGTYGDIYNFPLAQYHKALDNSNAEPDQQAIETKDAVETMGEESEEESEDEEEIEYVEDLDESEEEDIEDIAARLGQADGEPVEGSDDDSDSRDESDGTTDSESDDMGEEGPLDVTKRKRAPDDAAGPSSRKAGAVKRRPLRNQGPRKRGRAVELEVEHEHELQQDLNR